MPSVARGVQPVRPGGRLLVPPDLKGHLRNLLVLGEPEFFVKYEVLVVSSLDSALQLASSGSDPEGLVEAAPQFEELRRIATSKPVGELAVNTHVQARLNTICEAAPFHLSARMLLLQGSGRRPTRLDLATFRQELIRDLEPMNRVIWADTAKLTSVTLEQSFNECSKRLDSIETLVRVEDRPLREEAVGMANTLRTLARLRKQGLTTAAFTELHIQLKANYSKFLKDLGAAAPVPPPVGGP